MPPVITATQDILGA